MRSRKRSARIENITIRYATKAKEITTIHTTSQNDIAASFLWSTTAIAVCSLVLECCLIPGGRSVVTPKG